MSPTLEEQVGRATDELDVLSGVIDYANRMIYDEG